MSAGDLIGGRFELVAPLGRGGAGEVWRAHDRENPSSDAAVKLLRADLLENSRLRVRIAREARLLETLAHPHIARLRAFDVETAQPFIALDLIEGMTLGRRMALQVTLEEPFPLDFVMAVIFGLVEALDAVHRAGVVHRDVKPENVMLMGDQHPVLLDFGAARVETPAADGTTVGRVIGSWFYMAPEQIRGEAVDPTTDLYSLSIILFELLTLHRPFLRNEQGALASFGAKGPAPNLDAVSLLRRMVLEPAPRVAQWRPGLPDSIDKALARALHPERDMRFPSARELYSALADLEATIPAQDETRPTIVPTVVPFVDPTLIRSGAQAKPPSMKRPLALAGLVMAVVAGAVIAALPAPRARIADDAPEVVTTRPRAISLPQVQPLDTQQPAELAQPKRVTRPERAPVRNEQPAKQSELELAIEAARKQPEDATIRKQLRREIAKAAAQVADQQTKSSVERCLTAAEFSAGLDGLLECARLIGSSS